MQRRGRSLGFGSFTLGKRKEGGTLPGFVPAGYPHEEGKSKKYKSEENYFDESDEEEHDSSSTIPRTLPHFAADLSVARAMSDSEEDDPLDAFMAGIKTEIEQEKQRETKKDAKVVRDDIEEEDDQESYFRAVANAPIVIGEGDDDVEYEYDSDGNPIVPDRAKVIDPLPPIDHSEINYRKFEKNFYTEHKDMMKLSTREVVQLRKKLGIKATGYQPPKPCVSFAHFGFSEDLMSLIRKSEFNTPTPIQSQALPAALCGRDVIGIAKTGSGKTVAYLWPLLVHCVEQPELQEGDGPIGLICAPTRELCQQIYHQARKFARAFNVSVSCVYGGGSKWEQSQALKEGCEILVATPGRLIDLVKIKATNLLRVTYLVFDEADRMFDMGFEPQVRSIANHIRPDRQTLLFSATFRKKVERLCRDVLSDAVRVVVGDLGEANTDIAQTALVFNQTHEKWTWLTDHLVGFLSAGSILIFVTKKADSELVATSLRQLGYQAGLLHGDMSQGERDDVIMSFKRQQFPVLVATDVASRGLDIPAIKTVISYDVPKNIDTHVHRIGRTGRAGEKGDAYTLVTSKDVSFAGDLVRNLETAGQIVPDALVQLAMQNSRFRKSRQRHDHHGGQRGSFGGRRRERLGLGASKEMFSKPSSQQQQSAFSSGASYRTETIKEALQAQYKMRFQAASSQTFSSTSSLNIPSKPKPSTPSQQSPAAEASNITKKKKSRWD